MKKFIAAVLVLACIISCFAGCKSKEDKPDNTKIPVDSAESGTKLYDIPANEELKYDVDFDEYITLPDLASLELDYIALSNSRENIEQQIYNQQLSKAQRTEITDRPVQNKDIVTINYKIVYYGTDQVVSDRKDIEFTIGMGIAIPALEEAILGMSKGETKVTDIVYPADRTTNKVLANAKTTYTIELTKIETAELPELTDELIRSFDLGVSSYEGLYEYFSKMIDQHNLENKCNALYNALKAQAQAKAMPKEEYDHYIKLFEENAKANAQSMNITLENLIQNEYGSKEAYDAACINDAQNKVQSDLIVYALKEKFGIEITKEQYNKALNEIFKENAASVGITTIDEFYEKMGSSVYKGELTYTVLEAAAKLVPDAK